MGQAINRILPAGRPQDYKTYTVSSPISTHTRPARCEEVECDAHANGWVSSIDVSTDLGQRQAVYIRLHSGRHVSSIEETGTIVKFTFPAGQQCFADHRVSLERPALYLVRGGDWRGNPLNVPTTQRTASEWVDDFATHQQRVADAVKKG